jgi:hypothetical protein
MPTNSRRPKPTILIEHFRLLERFGKSKVQKTVDDKTKEQLWVTVCSTAGVPTIPLADVIEEWKQYISGQSDHSGIVISGSVDPEYTSIGVCYDRKITAAHTTRTITLLTKLLHIFRGTFKNKEAFLAEMEGLCKKISEEK